MRPIWCLSVLTVSLAAQRPLPMEAPIQRVRLHPDEAWVTRVGSLRLPGEGTHRVVVAGLPPGLRLEDLQVRAQGTPGLRLGDVGLVSEVRQVQETPEWKALESEREMLRERRDGMEAQGEANQQELTYLKGLQAAYDKEISARLTTTTTGTSAVELGKGIQVRMAELLTADRKRRRDLEKLTKEEARVDAEMRKRTGEQRTAPTRVTVEVTAPKEGRLELELSYRQRQAHWKPTYEARLSEDRSRLDLVLTAAVVQRTGEAWDGVRLEISNARPSLSLAVPTYREGETVAWEKEGRRYRSTEVGTVQAMTNSFVVESRAQIAAPAPSPQRPAAPAAAAVEATGTTIQEASGLAATFLVDGIKDVPSDGEPHRFRVLATSLAPTITLFTTPRLDPKAFLMARFETPQ
ncbi:MAG: mucoidy inhibitor MuiA family protein, partial [Holophaga sp.]|nr:mucoidy inhibitor MuiA family protein [Holophaga sp.]